MLARAVVEAQNSGMPIYETEFADARFKASDNPGPPQFIGTLETGPKTNKVLNDNLDFRLRLRPNVSFEQAERIAAYLNEYVDGISVSFSKP